MVGLKILFSVIAWLVWWGGLVLILQMDRRERDPEGSIAPYVLLGLLCGGFVLPIYFWVTRRTFSAALRGFGWAILLLLAAGFISFVGALATGVS